MRLWPVRCWSSILEMFPNISSNLTKRRLFLEWILLCFIFLLRWWKFRHLNFFITDLTLGLNIILSLGVDLFNLGREKSFDDLLGKTIRLQVLIYLLTLFGSRDQNQSENVFYLVLYFAIFAVNIGVTSFRAMN